VQGCQGIHLKEPEGYQVEHFQFSAVVEITSFCIKQVFTYTLQLVFTLQLVATCSFIKLGQTNLKLLITHIAYYIM